MDMLFVLLIAASAPGSTIECFNGAEAERAVAVLRQEPSPFGMVLGAGNDNQAKYLAVSTTHRLGVPGMPSQEGEERVKYYAFARDRVCSKEIELATCGDADIAIRTYRTRAYGVMHNRSQLRLGAAYHPPFALLHAKDGDGNTTRIAVTQSEHPLMHDAVATFSSIQSCTSDVDERLLGR